MKALVTGGTGFVGSHVARVLVKAGHDVRVLHRKSSRLDALAGVAFESAIGDLGDREALRVACEGCDWVFHVAAVADYWRSDMVQMFEANVEGTRNVLRAARAAGVQRVVLTSSVGALGQRWDGTPATEHDDFNLSPQRFPYGYSKALAEDVAQAEVRKGQDVVIVNPAVVMGPGDVNMIFGDFLKRVQQLGILLPIPAGGISVVDVRDVARMHLAAAEKGRTGERYILSTANVTYHEFFNMIADVVHAPKPILKVPNALLEVGATLIHLARLVGLSTPVDANQMRLGEHDIFFDGSKGWRELGEPQVPVRQSLEDSYAWFIANGYMEP